MRLIASIIILLVLIAGAFLLCYGACKVAGDVDEIEQKYWKERKARETNVS